MTFFQEPRNLSKLVLRTLEANEPVDARHRKRTPCFGLEIILGELGNGPPRSVPDVGAFSQYRKHLLKRAAILSRWMAAVASSSKCRLLSGFARDETRKARGNGAGMVVPLRGR